MKTPPACAIIAETGGNRMISRRRVAILALVLPFAAAGSGPEARAAGP